MTKLCPEGIKIAKKKFKVYPSAYANIYASRICKKLNGSKSKSDSKLKRWIDEKWINVCDSSKRKRSNFLYKHKMYFNQCGRKDDSKKYPYCRPLFRITKDTPKTVGELSKDEIKKRCRVKRSKKQGVKGKPTYVYFQKKVKVRENKEKKVKFNSGTSTEYRFIPLKFLKPFEKLSDERKVSEVARGVKKSGVSDMGFMEAYHKVKGNPGKLIDFNIKKSNPEGTDWWKRRRDFNTRHLAQMRKNNRDFFEKSGKYKYLPTRQHLGLLMWAYSPFSLKRLTQSLEQHKNYIFK